MLVNFTFDSIYRLVVGAEYTILDNGDFDSQSCVLEN
jgi:hypothetical protein